MKQLLALVLILGLLSNPPAHAADAPASAPAVPADWATLVNGFADLGALEQRLSDVHDPQLREELYRFLVAAAAQGFFGLLVGDPAHPDFYPTFGSAFNFMGPNPDNVYYMTPVDDTGVYRISGDRGTVHIIDFNLASGMLLANGTGELKATKANYDLDEKAHINKDGSFDVILSPTRPAGYTGDWWPLVPGTTALFLRQLSYDPLKEVDGRIAIERLDTPAIKPRATAERLAQNLALLSTWTRNWAVFGFDWQKRLVEQGLVNKVIARDISAVGGYTRQIYVEGTFDLARGEALILETDIPTQCRYWNVQLTDEKFAAVDIVNRQSWLNGRSARLDADGKFRAVISAQDPGVPNWLDTAGYRKGEILGRWNGCDSAPAPTLKKVAVADVRKHLPADTPSVTPEARDETIRLRRKGIQMRRRW